MHERFNCALIKLKLQHEARRLQGPNNKPWEAIGSAKLWQDRRRDQTRLEAIGWSRWPEQRVATTKLCVCLNERNMQSVLPHAFVNKKFEKRAIEPGSLPNTDILLRWSGFLVLRFSAIITAGYQARWWKCYRICLRPLEVDINAGCSIKLVR